MNISKQLAKDAKKKGICEPWHNELKRLDDKKAMVEMYVKGIDFCLSNDYPSNAFIAKHFKGVMEDFGVFLDDQIDIVNNNRCVSLGLTKGRIEVNSYGVCEVFAKHDSELRIIAKDNAFVEVDIFDNSTIYIHAQDRAKVHINQYGGNVISLPIPDGSTAMIKVVEKHKKTY